MCLTTTAPASNSSPRMGSPFIHLVMTRGPYSLCLHGQYVYVTDTISHCVFVFTTNGEYITSFGRCGKKDGNFNFPSYIYVDNNNFVYVADLYNDRIQCF